MTEIQSDNNILLDVKNLKKFFPITKGLMRKTVGYVKAVDDVSFFVREGGTLGLVGESGCGHQDRAEMAQARGAGGR